MGRRRRVGSYRLWRPHSPRRGLPREPGALARGRQRLRPLLRPHRRCQPLPGLTEEALRPLSRDRDRLPVAHGEVSSHFSRSRLPLRVDAPPGDGRARRYAAARLGPRHGPVQDRLVKPEERPASREEPEIPRVVAGGPAERVALCDRRAARSMREGGVEVEAELTERNPHHELRQPTSRAICTSRVAPAHPETGESGYATARTLDSQSTLSSAS
jgi:hypothetical protein